MRTFYKVSVLIFGLIALLAGGLAILNAMHEFSGLPVERVELWIGILLFSYASITILRTLMPKP